MTGIRSSVSITSPRSAQAASTASRSAMSAMLHPAERSGSIDVDLRPSQDVGRLGHEVNAAEDDPPALLALRRQLSKLQAVSTIVRERNDFVLLVMMAQDDQPISERLLRAESFPEVPSDREHGRAQTPATVSPPEVQSRQSSFLSPSPSIGQVADFFHP